MATKIRTTLLLLFGFIVSQSLSDAGISELTHKNNAFGFNLFDLLSKEEDSENIFFSPYSIATAIAMCYLGSRGETRTQIADTMGYTSSMSVKTSYETLITSLFQKTDNYTLTTANKFFGQENFDFEAEYRADLQSYYRAEAEEVDFAHNADATRRLINLWVETETHNTIKDLFPQGSISRSTILALVNALYFKADWLLKFEPLRTMTADFKLMDSSAVAVRMMHLQADVKVTRDDAATFKMVELPYKGDTMAMYIILPNEFDGINKIQESIDDDLLTLLIARMSRRKTSLAIPKFKVTQKMELPAILRSLGIRNAFSAGLADFSGISKNTGLFISDVFHQAYISIDEQGTEAAAATGIAGFRSTAHMEVFHVNRPFIFVVRDKITSSNLFVGRIVNPTTATRPLALRMLRSVDTQPQEGAVIGESGAGPVVSVWYCGIYIIALSSVFRTLMC